MEHIIVLLVDPSQNHVCVLSSCSFLINLLILYSTSALFFLHIFKLCLHPFWYSLSLFNSSCSSTFSFPLVANLFFKLLTSKFKFPIFRLTIAIVWKNSTTFYACITSIITFPTNFGVLVYVVGFLDPFANDRISCTNLLPNSNSNGNSLHILLPSTYISNGLNITKEGCVFTSSICNPIAYRPSYVYYCCYCCYCKCWKCYGFVMVSI